MPKIVAMWVRWGVLLGVLFAPLAGYAQNVPGAAQPGQIERRFEEPGQPRSTDKPVIPQVLPRAEPPANAEAVKFLFSGLLIDGVTAFDDRQLLAIYQVYLGEEVSLLTIYEIANKITALYRNAGYILSRAFLPPQSIELGIVRIKVVEGFIENVTFEGDFRDERNLFLRMGDKIIASRPLKVDILERYLLLMRDVPGYTVSSILLPGDSPGGSTLAVKIDFKPVDAAVSSDNRGSRFVGPIVLSSQIGVNSLAGLGERAQVRYIATAPLSPAESKELVFFDVTYRQILNDEGTSLSIRGSRSTSTPGAALEVDEIESASKTLSIGLRHPIIRSRARNLSAQISFDMLNSDVNAAGIALSRDRIRSLRVGLTYDFVDSLRGISLIDASISQGVKLFNASDSDSELLSRDRGRSDYTKLEASASRKQGLFGNFSLFAAASAQFSLHRLLSPEEFGVGGANFGRGYDPSEITGENGVAAKTELQYADRLDLFSSPTDYQLYAFYDIGAVWQREGDQKRDSLASAGAGIRSNISDNISGSLEYARPLTRDVESLEADGDEDRVFFSLSIRY